MSSKKKGPVRRPENSKANFFPKSAPARYELFEDEDTPAQQPKSSFFGFGSSSLSKKPVSKKKTLNPNPEVNEVLVNAVKSAEANVPENEKERLVAKQDKLHGQAMQAVPKAAKIINVGAPKEQRRAPILPIINVDAEAAKAAFEAAIRNGDAQEWGRAKLMLVGQGRAGKTSTVRSLLGLPFENTASTIGVDLKMTKAVDWKERKTEESDFIQQSYKAALARYEQGKEKAPFSGKNAGAAIRKISTRLSRAFSRSSKSLGIEMATPAEDDDIVKEDTQGGEEVDSSKRSSRTHGRRSSRRSPQDKEKSKADSKRVEIQPLMREEDVAREFDLRLVIKERERAATKQSNLAFSIWDYGGQEVFYTLHHIFLTKFGVYIICFDMSEALQSTDEVVRYVKFWLDSISLHAPESPFIVVGTFADKVPSSRDHHKIDEVFKKRLKLAGYKMLLPNVKQNIGFFPLDNSIGGGPAINELRDCLEQSVKNASYIKQQISLRWLKVLDDLTHSDQPHHDLEEVVSLAKNYGMEREECLTMLSYFHELGVLVHLTATEKLRQHVITKPQWLLDMLSLVINNGYEDGHARSAYDMEIRNRGLNGPYNRLREEGIASRSILEFLWEGHPVDYLIDLMRSMMLMSDWKFGTEDDDDTLFLVPALLPRGKIEKEMVGPTCYLDFSEFFLPTGVFQRLLALVAEYSSSFEDSGEPELLQGQAWLSFGFTDFRLDVLDGQDRIRIIVDQESEEAAKTIKVLVSMFRKLKDDVMSKLKWKLTVAAMSNPEACVRYELAAEAYKKGKTKVRGENRAVVHMKDLLVFFEDVQQGSLVEDERPEPTILHSTEKGKPLQGYAYHVFLSHKQSTAGDAVKALFLELSGHGFKCWYDQDTQTCTKPAMEKGVKESAIYLLFLSSEVFSSEYVKFELQTAMDNKKPIILVHESDPSRAYAYCDFGKYIETAPKTAKTLFEDVNSIPYRRYRYEADAMISELEKRILSSMDTASQLDHANRH